MREAVQTADLEMRAMDVSSGVAGKLSSVGAVRYTAGGHERVYTGPSGGGATHATACCPGARPAGSRRRSVSCGTRALWDRSST